MGFGLHMFNAHPRAFLAHGGSLVRQSTCVAHPCVPYSRHPWQCALFLTWLPARAPLAADTRGNVALFSLSGEELWSRHVKSMVSQVRLVSCLVKFTASVTAGEQFTEV
jgi:hypothetical protein